MRKTIDKLLQTVPAKAGNTLLIVAHGSTMEGCTRTLYGAQNRRQRDFDNIVRQIPYLASIRISEQKPDSWQMTEPLVPCLTHSANDSYRWEAFGDPNEMKKVIKK